MDSRPIFYQCVVIDNKDPLMLGRVRARIRTDNYEDIIKSVEGWNPETDPWTAKDPFIFNPLLPYFVYQIPEQGEFIQAMFVNRDFKYQNQYYVQNGFYSPNSVFNQDNVGGDKFTGTGMQYKSPKNIKNKNGTYINPASSGLYPEPGDNAILGRGNADLIVKKTELLLRAGKYSDTPQSNIEFAGNVNRAFLQLSIFDSIKKTNPAKTYFTVSNPTLQVKYLIEWVITNPENTANKFCGSVYLYQLKPSTQTNSTELSVSSVVPENLKTIIAQENFFGLPISGSTGVTAFINSFIKTCNDKDVSATGDRLFYDPTNKFPIFFRPSNDTYSYLNPSVPKSGFQNVPSPVCPPGMIQDIQRNVSQIFNNIKLNTNDSPGYGLIWKKNTVGTPEKIEKQETSTEVWVSGSTTINALGSDYLFLLTHKNDKYREQINLNNTLYGITGSTFFEEILPKTSSSVRGEELMELLNLIVRFLITHTHAYPGLPPVKITQDKTSVEQILTEIRSAYTKILNKYIRLN